MLLFLVFTGLQIYAGNDNDGIRIDEYKGVKLGSLSDFGDNSIKGIQKIDIEKYRLKVDGLVGNALKLDYKSLLSMPHLKKLITLNCVEGWSVTSLWEGIPLAELFKKVVPDKKADTVIFYAVDGYSTSLPYSYVISRNIVIADKVNGVTLPPAQGYPFILVAEDKWGYKWCRWIERIELSSNSGYKGYWEKRGYSNKGDLSSDSY